MNKTDKGELTPTEYRKRAVLQLNKVKESRKGRQYKYVRINPKTVVEIEVKQSLNTN